MNVAKFGELLLGQQERKSSRNRRSISFLLLPVCLYVIFTIEFIVFKLENSVTQYVTQIWLTFISVFPLKLRSMNVFNFKYHHNCYKVF